MRVVYRLAFILITLLESIIGLSQSKSLISYNAPALYLISETSIGKEINRKPLGKDVLIAVDTFFKTYTIAYIDENYKMAGLHLSYLSDEKQDRLMLYRMKDTDGNIYHVADDVKTLRKLKIRMDKQFGDRFAWLLIPDCKVVNLTIE